MNLTSSENIERFTSAVKRSVSIPVTVKLTHNVTDTVDCALAAQEGGADAITAVGGPSLILEDNAKGFPGRERRYPLTVNFLQQLHSGLHIDVSGMGGIYTWKDGVEYMAYGATNLQVAGAVSQYGPLVIEEMVDGLERYLVLNQVASVAELIDVKRRVVEQSGHGRVRELLDRDHDLRK